MLEDQGRDPVSFFGSYGIPRSLVLDDAIALAASGRLHDPAVAGPHVVTGPIGIRGARPGDVLEVEVLALERRAPYGIISNRHGKGALPGELPPAATEGPVCVLATVEDDQGVIAVGDGRSLRFPLNPFLGIMGVAAATERAGPLGPARAGTAATSTSTLFGVGLAAVPAGAGRRGTVLRRATRTSRRATARWH